jgi:ABC-type polysaccharide/polyol phosphate export permease
MRLNPLTYGVEALRVLLYPQSPTLLPLPASITALALFTIFLFGLCFFRVNRRTTRPAA